jgi:adenylate cyclase
MFDRLEVLNQQLVREGRGRLRMGIGIAAGGAMAGNIGTANRHNYTVVGDSVNVAARLQSMCKSMGMCLIGSEAIQRAGTDVLDFVPLGTVELAGHAPVVAYGVRERESFTPALRKIHLGESGSAGRVIRDLEILSEARLR